jgi:hypothetical protein
MIPIFVVLVYVTKVEFLGKFYNSRRGRGIKKGGYPPMFLFLKVQ